MLIFVDDGTVKYVCLCSILSDQIVCMIGRALAYILDSAINKKGYHASLSCRYSSKESNTSVHQSTHMFQISETHRGFLIDLAYTTLLIGSSSHRSPGEVPLVDNSMTSG
jgi:hypothetical protein